MSLSLIEFLSNMPTHLGIGPLTLLAGVWWQKKLEKWICNRQPDYQFITFKPIHSSSRRFRLDIGKHLFTQREVKHWGRLPWEVVDAPSPSVFRRHSNCVNCNNGEPLHLFLQMSSLWCVFPRTCYSWILQTSAFASTLL